MKISILAAVAKDGAIGRDGEIPWHFPEDKTRFRERTLACPVIMDQILYESIGHPLKNCLNIVVTRQEMDLSDQGVATARSVDDALVYAKRMLDAKMNPSEDDEVFCIGGAEIYRQAMPIADKIYLTRIDREYKGDACFPEIDTKVWRCIYSFCSGWHGKPDDRFLAYFLEFDRSKISNPTP